MPGDLPEFALLGGIILWKVITDKYTPLLTSSVMHTCRIYMDRERLNGSVRACLIDRQPNLAAQLKELKANLAAEQRAVSEQHYLVFRMLLSYTQGAWLLCHSFPYHCDCIAFLNGLEGL